MNIYALFAFSLFDRQESFLSPIDDYIDLVVEVKCTSNFIKVVTLMYTDWQFLEVRCCT